MVPLVEPLVAPPAPMDGDSKLTGMAELTVGDVMERDPVTITPDADLETLLRMLRENELPGLPVVDGRPARRHRDRERPGAAGR